MSLRIPQGSVKTLNPQILVTLWNVERLGSFSAVARETGWSQPAISQQIRKIERELDAKLVQRTSHGVELTPIGRILARHGQLIDNRVTQAVKDVEEYQRNGSTHIRLVAPHRYVRRSWHACSCISAKRPTFA